MNIIQVNYVVKVKLKRYLTIIVLFVAETTVL